VAYVSYGGNRSVIWTDVVQMLVIWVGIFACVGVAIRSLPPEVSLRDALAIGQAAGRLRTLDPSLSLTQPYTLFEGLLAGTFLALSYFGCDQSQVQRYLSGRSLRESRLSLLFNAALKIPMQFLILLTGVLVFVFYHFHPAPMLWNPAALEGVREKVGPVAFERLQTDFGAAEEERRRAALALTRASPADAAQTEAVYRDADRRLAGERAQVVRHAQAAGGSYNDTNYIFLTYVLHHLPGGLKGLIIAVIIAAAMSTLSGELGALASATMIDFYKRFAASPTRGEMLVSRLFTALWGLLACGAAARAGQLGSAIEVVNRFGSFFYGSILGVFALGVLTDRARPSGAVVGLVAGMAAVALTWWFTSVHFLWYNVIGALTVFVVGWLVSPRRA
jgi:Na+/proline symporter